jgi:hypothetical protein
LAGFFHSGARFYKYVNCGAESNGSNIQLTSVNDLRPS